MQLSHSYLKVCNFSLSFIGTCEPSIPHGLVIDVPNALGMPCISGSGIVPDIVQEESKYI